MGLRNVRVLILAVAAGTFLTGCSSFGIREPMDGAIVRLPGKTTVIVKATPKISDVVVKVDGTDVTNQIPSVSDSHRQGDLSLPAGKHSITADAEVPCWYCSKQKYHPSSQKNFCVAAETWPSMSSTYTAFARSDNLSWAKTSDTTVGIAADAGTPETRWNLVSVGGIGQSIGLIQSTENTCLCMQSMDAQSNTAIGFAICDPNNPLQQWAAFQIPNKTGHYRFQNNTRGASDACLTEGPNGVLIQRGCLDTDNQLWRIRDNMSGQLVPPF